MKCRSRETTDTYMSKEEAVATVQFNLEVEHRETEVKSIEEETIEMYKYDDITAEKMKTADETTSETVLESLSREKSLLVQQAVAKNLHTSPDTLEELYLTDNAFVMDAVLQNPNVFKSDSMVQRLGRSGNIWVIDLILKSDAVPATLLFMLLEQMKDDIYFRPIEEKIRAHPNYNFDKFVEEFSEI